MEEQKNNKIIICVIVVGVIILLGIGGYFLLNNKDNNKGNNQNTPSNNEIKESNYITINGNKLLRSALELSDNAVVTSTKEDSELNIVLVDINEPDFQFETHYLLGFDKDNKLIFDGRNFYDEANDGNRYKYSGKFEYNEDSKVLTFYTQLFLGDGEESTGKGFGDKTISELTSEELTTLGNYSDEVKYQYKYENNEFNYVDKEEISKLKDNEYYKEYFAN